MTAHRHPFPQDLRIDAFAPAAPGPRQVAGAIERGQIGGSELH